MTNYLIEPLGKEHNKASFSCGISELDKFLKEQASQQMRKKMSTTYVLTQNGEMEIMGYYSLAAYGINTKLLPQHITKRLPKYDQAPATLLGRLAVNNHYQGLGIGEYLLVSALQKSYDISQLQGSLCVIVEAINQNAVNFYKKYGFIQFDDNKNNLFITMKTISDLLSQ